MNGLVRPVAVVTGVVGLVAAVAALIREIALASDDAMIWTEPSWWHDLVYDGSGATAIAAVVASGLTILLLVLGARQFGSAGEPHPSRASAGEGAAVSIQALQRLVARRLGEAVPGVAPVTVRLRGGEDGWRAAVVADLVPVDAVGLQAKAAQVADVELRQATGQPLGSLDLEVRRFVRPAR